MTKSVFIPEYVKGITEIASLLYYYKSRKYFKRIGYLAKQLLIKYFPIGEIFKLLIKELVNEFDFTEETKKKIITYGAFYSKRCLIGYRYMAHFLAYIAALVGLMFKERKLKKVINDK